MLSMLSHGINIQWFIYLRGFNYTIDIKTKNNILLWWPYTNYAKNGGYFFLYFYWLNTGFPGTSSFIR